MPSKSCKACLVVGLPGGLERYDCWPNGTFALHRQGFPCLGGAGYVTDRGGARDLLRHIHGESPTAQAAYLGTSNGHSRPDLLNEREGKGKERKREREKERTREREKERKREREKERKR